MATSFIQDLMSDQEGKEKASIGLTLFVKGLELLADIGLSGNLENYGEVVRQIAAKDRKLLGMDNDDGDPPLFHYFKRADVEDIARILKLIDKDFSNEFLLHLREQIIVAENANEDLEWISYKESGNPSDDRAETPGTGFFTNKNGVAYHMERERGEAATK